MKISIDNKHILRKQFKIIRSKISNQRRQEASEMALKQLIPLFKHHQNVLSFVNFGSEIDISKINAYLLEKNKLLLPKVCEDKIKIYSVNDLSCLKKSSLVILEPNIEKCTPISPQSISLAIVPGLAFDNNRHRLGYGSGFYDKFLASTPNITSIGIGFLEQFVSFNLPVTPKDIPLSTIYLF